MASEIDDLVILYDSSVEITGRFHYKDELKIKEGSYGPCASFAVLIEKPKKDKVAKHYIFARAYGEKLVEKLKRIEKGTFIRVMGELESGFSGTYINVKVLTPVSAVELQDMLSRQREPEELPEEFNELDDLPAEHEELSAEDLEEITKEETEDGEAENELLNEPEPEPAETVEKQEEGWSSGWSRKKRRGIF